MRQWGGGSSCLLHNYNSNKIMTMLSFQFLYYHFLSTVVCNEGIYIAAQLPPHLNNYFLKERRDGENGNQLTIDWRGFSHEKQKIGWKMECGAHLDCNKQAASLHHTTIKTTRFNTSPTLREDCAIPCRNAPSLPCCTHRVCSKHTIALKVSWELHL